MRTLMFTHRGSASRNQRANTAGTMGRANVYETDERYLLQVAVPGIGRENISLSAVGSRLDISGERTPPGPKDSDPAGSALSDRLERSFQFSSRLDEAGIQASVANGLLTVHLPKTGARVIPVASQ